MAMNQSSSSARQKPFVSRKQVSTHNTIEDCWVIINEGVYSIPKDWILKHPGGKLTILSVAGKDATDPFVGFHDEVVNKKLACFHVANLAPEEMNSLDDLTKEFRLMEKDLRAKGLFKTNYLWYGKLMIWICSLFILSIAGVVFGTSWTVHFFSALTMGIFFQQLAFVGHDLAHNAVTHSRYNDTLLATLLSFFAGISCQWWKYTHNVHHIVTNSLEFDPDIQHLPVISITEKYFKNIFSEFHRRILPYDAISSFCVSKQHVLYYPIMCFSRFNLYLQCFIMHIKSRDFIPFRILDLIFFSSYFVWYFYLLSFLPSFERQLMFFLVSHLGGPGLLAVQITISHFAMPVFEGVTKEDYVYNFVKVQVEHSMDVDCEPWMDWLHGGLQFQVVHHLFPRVPRHNLRLVLNQYLLPFLKKHNLKYHAYSFVEANKLVISTLRDCAIKAKAFKFDY